MSTPGNPEQRPLLAQVAAITAKERLNLDLPLPPAVETAKAPPLPELRVPARADGPSLKAPLKLLTRAERMRLARQFGGSPQTERAVERGLTFLARCQDVDGAWRARSFADLIDDRGRRDAMRGNAEFEVAMTGLAVLAFVATGNSPEQGEHSATVAKGTRFLMSRLLDYGRFETGASHYMYNHAIATQALCEVYAYTANPTLGVYAQLAVDYLLRAQHRGTGGWRYEPDQAGDTSVLGWVVMALNSAYKGQLDVAGFRDALRFLDSVTENQYYRVGYTNPTDHGIFGNRLGAVGVVSRRFLGQDPKDARLFWPVVRMLDELPDPANPDYYYWYYGTLGMFQAGGDAWKAWGDKIAPALLALHEESDRSPFDGSWRNDRHHSGHGGRIYNTTVAILTLTTYYRYDRTPKTKLAPFTGDIDKALAPYLTVLHQVKPDEGLLAITEAKVVDAFGAYLVPPFLRELAQPHPEKVRRRLAALIEQAADDRSEGALLQNLAVSDDIEVRKALVRTLERVCTAKSEPALIAAMQTDKNGHVRGHAARALGGLGGDGAVPALTARLAEEGDAWARGQMQDALRRLQSRSALDALIALGIPDERGRAEARVGLSILGRDQLADRIEVLAKADAKLHKRIVEAVRIYREHAALPVLICLLEADDEGLRTNAIGLLEALTRERHGYDPKHDAAARRDPLKRWYTWWDAQQHRFGVQKKR
ncbi:MAG: HEAT repeat domain-containing protein [Phycisphaerales bacterium]|nr:HEAT repeat domain-containing protein [Phycisphaerales bacterium]